MYNENSNFWKFASVVVSTTMLIVVIGIMVAMMQGYVLGKEMQALIVAYIFIDALVDFLNAIMPSKKK